MKTKKRILTGVIVVMLIALPMSVYAHPGGLDSNKCHYCRTNCSKWGLDNGEYHCHSGDTYSNSKGEIYDKSGTKMSDGNTSNNNSAEKEENNNNSNSNQDKPSNNLNGSANNSTTTQKPRTSTTKPVEKSKDVTLKIVKVDNNEIIVEEQMQYSTKNKNVELNIEATDSKAKVEFDNKELIFGENEILIKVTAEAGNSKEYKLIINRKEIQSEVIIKKFVLGTSEVKFEDNKATIEKLATDTNFEYSYELSDKTAKLLLYVNDKKVTKLNNIKNHDIIKLVIIDNNNNKNIYEINVVEKSEEESSIISDIIGVLGLVGVGTIIYKSKKNKKSS